MSEKTTATAYPLAWPVGWKRTPVSQQMRSHFGRRFGSTLTVYAECQVVLGELKRLSATDPLISTNLKVRQDGIPYSGQKDPNDAGAAVYFRLGGRQQVLACDRWWSVAENLHAIAKHIDALRGQERWGVGSLEQAFAGYMALPEHASGRAWWDVLGFDGEAENIQSLTRAEIEERFKKLALRHHPDRGGDAESWHALHEARSQALAMKRT